MVPQFRFSRPAALALAAALALSLTACQRIDRSAPLPEGSSSADQSAQEVLAPQPDASAPDQSAPDGGAPVPEEPQQVQPQAPAYDFSQPAPQSEPVDNSYFDDAAFVGDSRTDGFMIYSGIGTGTNLTSNGLSIFKLEEKKALTIDGVEYTLLEALALDQYGKVYICPWGSTSWAISTTRASMTTTARPSTRSASSSPTPSSTSRG